MAPEDAASFLFTVVVEDLETERSCIPVPVWHEQAQTRKRRGIQGQQPQNRSSREAG